MMDGPTFTQTNEGLTLTAKLDRNGKYECGYGCQGMDIGAHTTWTPGYAEQRFDQAYALARCYAREDIGQGFDFLDLVRQAAAIDMAYELGEGGLAKFARMIRAIRAADWTNAYAECLASDYAGQVPGRAQKCAAMLLTGEWPGGGSNA